MCKYWCPYYDGPVEVSSAAAAAAVHIPAAKYQWSHMGKAEPAYSQRTSGFRLPEGFISPSAVISSLKHQHTSVPVASPLSFPGHRVPRVGIINLTQQGQRDYSSSWAQVGWGPWRSLARENRFGDSGDFYLVLFSLLPSLPPSHPSTHPFLMISLPLRR